MHAKLTQVTKCYPAITIDDSILNSNGRKYFVEDLHISSTIRIYETREVIK